MILGFKTQWNGEFTQFVQKILACKFDKYRKDFIPKIHSIRKGQRWKAGDKIHMATGVRTTKYYQFNGGDIGLDVCKGVQLIHIDNNERLGKRVFIDTDEDSLFITQLTSEQIETLAKNDGFDSVEKFWEWFNSDFTGQIIHWTDHVY